MRQEIPASGEEAAMPLYDFRCAGCGAIREVRASFGEASGLELICTSCGGTMMRALSKKAPMVLKSRAGASPPPHPSAPTGGKARARTCEDGAVRLTRPNPFATVLPRGNTAEGSG
jgi:putative FmdB family regulatory protein